MLRGALTINNIKASYQGSPLHIGHVLIKGDPTSIASDKPILQQVLIQQISIDAYGASQSWQDLSYELSPSLKGIFYFAKNIHIQGGSIQHIADLPEVMINDVHISGVSNTRKMLADGYINSSENHWEIQSLFPMDTSQQTGTLSSSYKNIQNHINWSGTWSAKNFTADIQQRTTQPLADVTFHIRQQNQHWAVDFDAHAWPIQTPFLNTSVTGQGEMTGTPRSWTLTSQKAHWTATNIPSHSITIANITSNELEINSKEKKIYIRSLDLDNPEISMDTSQNTPLTLPWQTHIQNINIKKLNASILVQKKPIKIPELDGTAKIQQSNIQFDLSSQSLHEEFWHLQTKNTDEVYLTVSNSPLAQLRNLLPDPIRQQALTLEGTTSLKLTIQPNQKWRTSGEVRVSKIHLASKNQAFKAEHLQVDILDANTLGMHQASLHANHWLMQFPLTPMQAWSDTSHLDEWISIPWTLSNLSMTQGQIALGSENQVWVQNASLNIQHWQSKKPAQLQFKGIFGMATLSADMELKPSDNHIMQWQSLKLSSQYGDLYALSEWLSISNFPVVEKGHMNLNLSATRDEKGIQGITQIDFTQLVTTPIENDILQQYSNTPTQRIIQQLSNKHRIQLNSSFQGSPQSDWTTLAGQSLRKAMLSKLEKGSSPSSTVVRRTKALGSLRIHQENPLSQNERSRLRKMMLTARNNRGWHIELKPELGTANFSSDLKKQIHQTQILIKSFMAERGIPVQNIYFIAPQEKHKSSSSAGAIHINLVK